MEFVDLCGETTITTIQPSSCSEQNFEMIGQLKCILWTMEIHEIWVSDKFWKDILYCNKLQDHDSIKMLSYQYRKCHCGDKMIIRLSYLHNGNSYTGKKASLYWISPQIVLKMNTLQLLGTSIKKLVWWMHFHLCIFNNDE